MSRQSIGKESVEGITPNSGPAHGHTVVGTTASKLTPIKFSATYKGVLVVADSANIATVFIGREVVTADNDIDTGGIPLPAGASIFIPIEDPTLLFVVSGSAAQDVAWLAL